MSAPGAPMQSKGAGAAPVETRRRGRPPLDQHVRRRRILTVAGGLFATNGFSATSVEQIGKAAGVTKRTIYALVGDKEAVFREVCREFQTRTDQIRFDLAFDTGSLHDLLFDLAQSILTHSLSQASTLVTRAIANECAQQPELVARLLEPTRAEMQSRIAQVFERLAADGTIDAVEPAAAADLFYDTLVGAKKMRAVLGFNEQMPADEEVHARVGMIIHGYLRRR